MDEQRILDEMERMLAADDPRLAARLAAFGQPGLGHALRTRRARATLSVMVLVLVAAVAAVIYLMSSFRPGNIPTGHGGQGQHSATPSKRAVTRPADGRATGAPAGRIGRSGQQAGAGGATRCTPTFAPGCADWAWAAGRISGLTAHQAAAR